MSSPSEPAITHTVQHQQRHQVEYVRADYRCIWCGNRADDIERFGSNVCAGPNKLIVYERVLPADDRVEIEVTKVPIT